MGLLSKGGDWKAHPQGLWTGTLTKVEAVTDTFGERIRWTFETNCRDDDDKPMRVSLKSSYKGLGNEKAWLTRIIEAFGHNCNDKYWTEIQDLTGFDFLIEDGATLGLEVKHYKKTDGSDGDTVSDVMTVDALETRKAQLRASLDAGSGPRPGGTSRPSTPVGETSASRPATGGTSRPMISRSEPSAPAGTDRSAPPDDYVPEAPADPDNPFQD